MSESAAQPDPTPAQRFQNAMKQILSVSKPEILRREAEYREQRKAEKKNKAA